MLSKREESYLTSYLLGRKQKSLKMIRTEIGIVAGFYQQLHLAIYNTTELEGAKLSGEIELKDRTVLFEPRGAWKILLDSEFFGGNAFVSRLRRDPISASDSDFQFWR